MSWVGLRMALMFMLWYGLERTTCWLLDESVCEEDESGEILVDAETEGVYGRKDWLMKGCKRV